MAGGLAIGNAAGDRVLAQTQAMLSVILFRVDRNRDGLLRSATHRMSNRSLTTQRAIKYTTL